MATEPPGSGSHDHLAVVRWLASPETWGNGTEQVATVETHISLVFLVGQRVYKLKKPVTFAFLDFSTLAAREHACREEVRLNRRLAPDIYPGVRAVTLESDGRFALDGNGRIVDWLVEMRRLPAERMLDKLHEQNALRADDIDRLAVRLVEFYRGLPPTAVTPEAYLAHCRSHVQGNRTELLSAEHHLSRAAVLRTQGFQLQQLNFSPQLFRNRVDSGKIIDGHGDLRPEHICFTDSIVIFDCIEFCEDFRQLDRADEIAFLISECDFIGADWVGRQLFERYQEQSHDRPPAVLFDFYKAYRASVRAKVAALRADQLAGDEKAAAVQEAARHLDQADRYAAPHLLPLVLVIGGLSGSGKTTLARTLSAELAAELLRSDVIRQCLFAEDACGNQPLDKYSPESREHVYVEMFQQADRMHQQDVSVILDATFNSVASVRAAQAVASGKSAVFLAIKCCCRPEVARERIARRLQQGRDASEARPGLFNQQQAVAEPWPDDIPQCRIDTEQPIEDQCRQVISVLRKLVND